MKILFIGNSHTYMNDMPELTREMIESATGKHCEVFMLAYSGRSLKWHIEEEYFSVRFNILFGEYDYCIIQEQAHPMANESDTTTYTSRIVGMCKKVKTKPIIFETWAEKTKPENQSKINYRYQKIAKSQRVLLAPVGEVWLASLREIEKISDCNLYRRDGAHASVVGDYLIAMVLTKVITSKLPKRNFLKAYDFTLSKSCWLPVQENVADEEVKIPSDIAEIIRKNVINYTCTDI